MLLKHDGVKELTTWTNGQKAVVHLIELPGGERQVLKIYKPGYLRWMLREYSNLFYLSKKLQNVPKLVRFKPIQRELTLSYIHGQRVLEWVLQNFGAPNLSMEEFLNFEPIDTDQRVAEAFLSFRQSDSKKAYDLKLAIKESYKRLHGLRFQHGTADPRNVIYDGHQVFIIDFDHARPGLTPIRNDYRALTYWFGIHAD